MLQARGFAERGLPKRTYSLHNLQRTEYGYSQHMWTLNWRCLHKLGVFPQRPTRSGPVVRVGEPTLENPTSWPRWCELRSREFGLHVPTGTVARSRLCVNK